MSAFTEPGLSGNTGTGRITVTVRMAFGSSHNTRPMTSAASDGGRPSVATTIGVSRLDRAVRSDWIVGSMIVCIAASRARRRESEQMDGDVLLRVVAQIGHECPQLDQHRVRAPIHGRIVQEQ